MESIKEECLLYSIITGIKSDIKNAEVENETLKGELRKLQEDCMALNSRILSINWKIQQAEFVLECEKKKHNRFYDIMQAGESKHSTKPKIPLETEIRNTCLN